MDRIRIPANSPVEVRRSLQVIDSFMADNALSGNAVCRVATATGVDMKTSAKVTLYTVPTGKTFYPVAICVRTPSASLAGGTDYDIGSGAAADTWRQGVDLSSMTASTDYMMIFGADVTKYTASAAGETFGIKPITGSTLAATAVIDVFGFLA